jgi:hypothetical protein
MKCSVFVAVFTDYFALRNKEDCPTNYSGCLGVYTTRELALAALEKQAHAFAKDSEGEVRAVPEACGGGEYFEVRCPVGADDTSENVDGTYHVSEHVLELEDPPPPKVPRRRKVVRLHPRSKRNHDRRPAA